VFICYVYIEKHFNSMNVLPLCFIYDSNRRRHKYNSVFGWRISIEGLCRRVIWWVGGPVAYRTSHRHYRGDKAMNRQHRRNLISCTWMNYGRLESSYWEGRWNPKAGLHWSSWMIVVDESSKVNSMDELTSVYIFPQHSTGDTIQLLALYSFVLNNFLMMAPRCRNM
jgi:hypothetical protein